MRKIYLITKPDGKWENTIVQCFDGHVLIHHPKDCGTYFYCVTKKFDDFIIVNRTTILIYSKLNIEEIHNIVRNNSETVYLILQFDSITDKYNGLLHKDVWNWIQLKELQMEKERNLEKSKPASE